MLPYYHATFCLVTRKHIIFAIIQLESYIFESIQ